MFTAPLPANFYHHTLISVATPLVKIRFDRENDVTVQLFGSHFARGFRTDDAWRF